MKSPYEKRIKMLEESNLALTKTYRKLQVRIYWIVLLLATVTSLLILEEVF